MKMQKIKYLVDYIKQTLDELYIERRGEFEKGQAYSLVDVLEAVQTQLSAGERELCGLGCDVEAEYPLD